MSLAVDRCVGRRVGRRQINHESAIVRFPDGTLERIKVRLMPGETQASFLRDVVVKALERREAGDENDAKD